MLNVRQSKALAFLLSFWMTCYPLLGYSEDISIFVGSSAGASGNPNVLIVLDNTSNWARQSQQWPGGLQQGQSEARAIQSALAGVGPGINVGLMEFVTNGNANDQGGFVRYAVHPMNDSNKTNIDTKLDTIFNNVTSPNEKRNSNTPYGDLMYDVYNYFGSLAVSNDGSNASRSLNPPNNDTDGSGYSTSYSQFLSPLSTNTSCARNYVIFIGNPNSSGPSSDSSANTSALTGFGCSASQLALPNIGSVPTSTTTVLGNTGTCYASAAAAQTAYGYGLNAIDNISRLYVSSATATDYQTACAGYTQGCVIGAASPTTNAMACPTGQQSYHVIQTITSSTTSGPTAQTPTTTSASTTSCYASSAAANTAVTTLADIGGLTCPATTVVTVGNVTTTTTHSCTYSLGAATSTTCSSPTTTTHPTTACFATAPSSPTSTTPATTPAFSCPAGDTCSYSTGAIASTCSSPAVQTGTTGYLASAPTPASPATGSSVATTPSLSCTSGWTCTYAASVASTAPGGGSTSGTTTSAYSSAPAFPDIDNSTNGSAVAQPGTTLSCPANNACTYATGSINLAAGAGSGSTTGNTTGYYSTAPSFPNIDNTAGTSAVAQTGTTLSCPALNACTYTVGAQGAAAPGGGTTSGATASYTTTAPSAPAAINNYVSATSTAVPGTNLSCPAYNSCTYSVPGTTSTSVTGGTTSGTTTGYYASTPSFPTIDNTNVSSATGQAGTNLSCPAHTSCAYSIGTPPTVPRSSSDTSQSSATTTTYYSSSPTITTSLDNSSGSTSSPYSFGGASLSCPPYSTCSYAAAQATRNDTGSTTQNTANYYSTASPPSTPTCDNTAGSTSKTCTVGGTNFQCPPYASCTYTATQTSTSQGANSSTKDVYAASAPNCPSLSLSTQAQQVSSACVRDNVNPLVCPANTSCTYSYTTGSKQADVGSVTFNTDCTNKTITATPSYSVINDGFNGTTGNGTYSFGTMTFTNDVTLTSFTCGKYQYCVYTPNSVNGSNCGNTGTNSYKINGTETGLTKYTITQTPSPSVQYLYSVQQTVNPSAYPYTVTQTPTTSRSQYNLTQTATAANEYVVQQTATPAHQYAVTQNATGSTATYNVTQTATPAKTYTITQTPVPQYTWNITQTETPTAVKYTAIQTDTPSVTTVTNSSVTNDLGQTSCMASAGIDHDYDSQCVGTGLSCTYNTSPSGTTNHCASGTQQYQVSATNVTYSLGALGTTFTDTGPRNADEWARCLFRQGVPVSGGTNEFVTTYTIDVYNAQPNATQTSLLLSMAKNGGGKYFNATNEAAIVTALKQIVAEIQSVNSTFASASLPINATNRAQNANQVFIGMFRPDPDAKPRWFGNVKRYQLITDALGDVQLGDVNGNNAINNNTGFITECAQSYWTSDSSNYWENYAINPNPASTCTTTSNNIYSDAPDGPRVEKGATAEVIRRGNNPSSPSTAVNRTMYFANGTTLNTFNAANTAWSSTTNVDWAKGIDTEDENGNANITTETRASLHGDVIHSRPLPVNYCTTSTCSNTVIYYGANDGTLRAVDADTGKEKWAFVAPEFTETEFQRLRLQTPLVNYPNVDATLNPQARDYFFDGSIGLYQTATNDKVWIFPTMRRGGRMVYALDVTNSSSAPSIKWKLGCPHLGDDTGCSTGATSIGQTWSLPSVAVIKGYSTTAPVLAFGGGYDACEDGNTSSPSCGSPKGNVIFIVDADTGAIIQSFSTLRSVVGDVAYIDMDGDGKPDYLYAADTGGNIYRVSFSSYNSATGIFTPLNKDSWVINRVAYTSGAGRKFLFAPAVFGAGGSIYLALASGDREHPLQSDYPYSTPVTNRFYTYRDCLSITASTTSSLASGDSLDDTSKMFNATSLATEVSSTQAALAVAQAADTASSTATTQANLALAQAAYNAALAAQTAGSSCGEPKTLPANCSVNKGWFKDLAAGTGEQGVTSTLIADGLATFSTNRPIPAASGTCSTALGEARGYFLNILNGSGAVGVTGNCGGTDSATFVGGGLPPSPVLGVVPINGVPTTVIIGAAQRTGNASSSIAPQKASPTSLPARKRVYNSVKGTDN